MRVAILGTRGIPANYGGFETFAEELSRRLVRRGHSVLVYGRSKHQRDWFTRAWCSSVKTAVVPALFHKYLETISHTFFSFLDCSRTDADVILLCNAANSIFIPIANLKKIPVAVNVDGIERKRAKWNFLGRCWYRLGEIASVLFARRVVADAQVIADYYRSNYNVQSSVIAYGAERREVDAAPYLKRWDLTSKSYLLYVSRFEPENNALGVLRAYINSNVQLPLVMVGDAPYAASYKQQLQDEAHRVKGGARVVFTGFQFGDSYHALRDKAYAYIQASEVGGTHPALVEAMAYGNCVLANDVPEHREVLENCGLYYRRNDFDHLSELIERVVKDRSLSERLGTEAQQRAAAVFTWDLIAAQYEKLLLSLASGD